MFIGGVGVVAGLLSDKIQKKFVGKIEKERNKELDDMLAKLFEYMNSLLQENSCELLTNEDKVYISAYTLMRISNTCSVDGEKYLEQYKKLFN